MKTRKRKAVSGQTEEQNPDVSAEQSKPESTSEKIVPVFTKKKKVVHQVITAVSSDSVSVSVSKSGNQDEQDACSSAPEFSEAKNIGAENDPISIGQGCTVSMEDKASYDIPKHVFGELKETLSTINNVHSENMNTLFIDKIQQDVHNTVSEITESIGEDSEITALNKRESNGKDFEETKSITLASSNGKVPVLTESTAVELNNKVSDLPKTTTIKSIEDSEQAKSTKLKSNRVHSEINESTKELESENSKDALVVKHSDNEGPPADANKQVTDSNKIGEKVKEVDTTSKNNSESLIPAINKEDQEPQDSSIKDISYEEESQYSTGIGIEIHNLRQTTPEPVVERNVPFGTNLDSQTQDRDGLLHRPESKYENDVVNILSGNKLNRSYDFPIAPTQNFTISYSPLMDLSPTSSGTNSPTRDVLFPINTCLDDNEKSVETQIKSNNPEAQVATFKPIPCGLSQDKTLENVLENIRMPDLQETGDTVQPSELTEKHGCVEIDQVTSNLPPSKNISELVNEQPLKVLLNEAIHKQVEDTKDIEESLPELSSVPSFMPQELNMDDDFGISDSQLCAISFDVPTFNQVDIKHSVKSAESTLITSDQSDKFKEGRNILQGLIKDISGLNKMLLKTKREIEAFKRKRGYAPLQNKHW